jgi:hypothetical protein
MTSAFHEFTISSSNLLIFFVAMYIQGDSEISLEKNNKVVGASTLLCKCFYGNDRGE